MKITVTVEFSPDDDLHFADTCRTVAEKLQVLAVLAITSGHERLYGTRHELHDPDNDRLIGDLVISISGAAKTL